MKLLCLLDSPNVADYSVRHGQALDVWKPSKSFSGKAETKPDFRCVERLDHRPWQCAPQGLKHVHYLTWQDW